MFQPQSTPFSSAPFFSSLPSSHGLELAPSLGLSQAAHSHAGDGELGPTHFLAHHSPSGPSSIAGIAGLLSSSCATAALHPHHNHHHHQQAHLSQRHPHQPHQPHQPSSSSQALNGQQQHQSRPTRRMDEQGSHDLAAQQEAAKDYRPDLQGPRIGHKTPSSVITHEYAKADPVYIEKTAALPESYSHYRPIQGDGNCGWRAIGFAYFEKLVEGADQAQVEGEVARLKSFNNLLATVGGYDYFEDFAEEAFALLREVAAIVETPQAAHNLVLQRWNDDAVEGSLIFYFRLLAATFLKANAGTYEPFIPGGLSVAGYCSQNIEIINREIEHLGIVALVNILLKPVNFVLEIAYLDRSPGSQVNQYRLPEEANSKDPSTLGPIIYLLYRPDHYDILYRSTVLSLPVAATPPQDPVHVNRVSNFTHNTAFLPNAGGHLGNYSTVDFGALSMIPGLSSGAGGGLSAIMPVSTAPSAASAVVNDGFASNHQDQWLPPYASETTSGKAESQQQSQPPSAIATLARSSSSASLSPNTPLCPPPSMIPAGVGAQQLSSHLSTPGGAGYPIRFSPHQLEYESNSFPEPTFQVTTNTFKNSVWNRAHYGNPDFQPEEWNPEDDSIDNRLGGKRKAKRDS